MKSRDDLTGEPAIGILQLILACLFFTVWIADSYFFQYTTILNRFVPLYIRILLAAVLLVFAIYIARRALSAVFDRKIGRSALITEGVFAATRHPIYLSEIMLYLSFITGSLSLAAMAVWIIIMMFLYLVSRREEKQLLALFGDEYRQYMHEVPMWIPRIRR